MRNSFFPGSQIFPGLIKAIRSLTLMLPGVLAVVCAAHAQGLTGSVKGTVSANSGNAAARPELLPGASLTLVNRDVPTAIFKSISDETGNFVFLVLPASTYILNAEAKGQPAVTREIKQTAGANLIVEI